MTRLSIRIFFEPPGSGLGPGMAQLLERVGQLGSIRSAAASMDMSYRKAWLLIQKIQKTFNGPVVTAVAGGAAGGGTQLTELGESLLKLYRRVETRAANASRSDLETLTALVRSSAAPRRQAPRKSKS